MRKLAFLTAFAALLLSGAISANAQQKDTPAKAQGAGAECSRMTDAKMRDDCVRQSKQNDAKTKKDQTGKSAPAAKEGQGKGKKS